MSDKKNITNKLILQVKEIGGREDVNHYKINDFPTTIGRGFDNDIILNDPYVSENHIQIEKDEEGQWILKDLDSLNGYSINKSKSDCKESYFKSGDFINIGNTVITFFQSNHKIEQAKKLVVDNKFIKTISKSHVSWFLFLSVGFLSVAWSYFEIWSRNAKEGSVSYAVIVLSAILLWSVIWGISGRLIHNKKSFSGQMSIICLWVISIGILSYISKYLEYFTGGGILVDVVINAADIAALTVLIFACLTLFGNMTSKRRWSTAIIFSLGLLIGIVGFDLLSNNETVLKPEYSKIIEPSFTSILPSINLEEFIVGLENNFQELQKEK